MPETWTTIRDFDADPTRWTPVFDAAVARVMADDGGINRSFPPTVGALGHDVSLTAVITYRLRQAAREGFDADVVWAFVEAARRQLTWTDIDAPISTWLDAAIGDVFFVRTSGSSLAERLRSDDTVTLNPISGVTAADAQPDIVRFACLVAIAHLRFGPSYYSVRAKRLLDQARALGSPLPDRFMKVGSGNLPAHLAKMRDGAVTGATNDVLAKIRITVASEDADSYVRALQYVCDVIDDDHVPTSFAIDFRGPTKTFTPGLAKKGVNQLFTCAAAHPEARPLIERYARAAMTNDAWYTNIDDEDPAMPGTFAVTALALADSAFVPLAVDFFATVDGEHQRSHLTLVQQFIQRHGMTPDAALLLVAGAASIDDMPPQRGAATAAATPEGVQALRGARAALNAGQISGIDAEDASSVWQRVLTGIWGPLAVTSPDRALKKIPADIRPDVADLLDQDVVRTQTSKR